MSEEFLEPAGLIAEPLLHEFSILGQDRDLRTAFVQVDAHVYHRCGLLSQRGLPPSLRSQPLFQAGQEANVLMTSEHPLSALPRWLPIDALRRFSSSALPIQNCAPESEGLPG